jgi:hypothetical protein
MLHHRCGCSAPPSVKQPDNLRGRRQYIYGAGVGCGTRRFGRVFLCDWEREPSRWQNREKKESPPKVRISFMIFICLRLHWLWRVPESSGICCCHLRSTRPRDVEAVGKVHRMQHQ